ncbi:MAG: DNA-protecting protein DprA [Sphingobacteriales bacterium]|nr:DNA-protecting protein DprA [Sphingobacteriales bacterium]
MHPDLLYQLALTMVPNIGPVQAKILLQHCEAEEIFHAKKSFLEKIEGIGPVRAESIQQFHNFHLAEEEIKWMEKYKIRALFLTDDAYPKRLLNCYDPPTLLFVKGEADLNASRILSVIGTRSHTEYGRQQTEQLVKELAAARVTIVSGLAYGVDALAHKAALRNELPTIGVLAHGLDQVYPPEHGGLAKDMIKNSGGILSEFRCNVKPDKHNFPSRNRIVAGMADATVVIETGIKGGSMITAELANNYNKDVFALPGKLTDPKSAGCNQLIKTNKAALLTDVPELIEMLGWGEQAKGKTGRNRQRELFIELSPEERTITEILNVNTPLHIDEINLRSGLSSSVVAGALLNLELQSLVLSLPGKQYRLV